MTETVEDITYIKFLGTPEVVTPVVTAETAGLWARYEVVNMGTADTTGADSVDAAACLHNAVIAHVTHTFDSPVLAANGGSYQGTIHIPFDQFPYPGDWELSIQVNRPGYGEGISDHIDIPFSVVHAAG